MPSTCAPWIEVKRAAIRAHRSQLTSTSWLPRNNAMLIRLPRLALEVAMGWERYVDPSRPASAPVLDDVFADL